VPTKVAVAQPLSKNSGFSLQHVDNPVDKSNASLIF